MSLFPPGNPSQPLPPSVLPYLVGVAVVIILLILVLGMLAAKRKHKHGGPLWLPDGFIAKKNDKRREPVGQDDFDMK